MGRNKLRCRGFKSDIKDQNIRLENADIIIITCLRHTLLCKTQATKNTKYSELLWIQSYLRNVDIGEALDIYLLEWMRQREVEAVDLVNLVVRGRR